MSELKDARQALIEAYTFTMTRHDARDTNVYRDPRLRGPFQHLLRTFEQPDGPRAWSEVKELCAFFVKMACDAHEFPESIRDMIAGRLQEIVELAEREHPIWVTPPPSR